MTNAIWKIDEPPETRYARCWLRSPDEVVGGSASCPSCSRDATWLRPYPLAIEWEPGSDVLGDFSWPGGGRPVVRRVVGERIQGVVGCVSFGQVDFVAGTRGKGRRREPVIRLPYRGPELVELIVPHHVAPARLTVEANTQCDECGRDLTRLTGVEEKKSRWNAKARVLVPDSRPRQPGHGVFVERAAVTCPLFRIEAFPLAVLCTDEIKQLLETENTTNVTFLEYGEVIP